MKHILTFFFCIITLTVCAQDTTCNKLKEKEILTEIEALKTKLRAMEYDATVDTTVKYQIIYKYQKDQRQVLPKKDWVNTLCVQRYDKKEGKPLTDIKLALTNIADRKFKMQSYDHGKYLVLSSLINLEGDQTSWFSSHSYYFMKAEK